MKNMNLNDLQIFYQVAKLGSLTAAAEKSGISVPTVGRRMLAIEQACSRAIFTRSQAGYRLTDEGRLLFDRVKPLIAAARTLDDLFVQENAGPFIKISAGTGTSNFLADNFSRLWNREDRIRLAFVTGEQEFDISHRDIDLGIRNRPPDSGNLAYRKLEKVRFAPYKNRHVIWHTDPGWIALDPEHAYHPASKWVLQQKNILVNVTANSVFTLQKLVQAGAGIGVMPCFVGDRIEVLVRAGPVIESLTETQYLVMHDDERHRPELRVIVNRLVELFGDHSALFAGERALS